MNDELSPDDTPLDDEIVNAVLDGEATAAQRALVEGSPAARRRMEELQEVARAVAEPVTPLGPDLVDRLVGRALAPSSGREVDAGPNPVVELTTRRRTRRPTWRTVGGIAAAVVAAVVVLGGVATLAQRGGRSSSDQSASADSASGGDSSVMERAAQDGGASTGSAAEDSPPPSALLPVDLGPLADAAAVLEQYGAFIATPEGARRVQEFAARATATDTNGVVPPAAAAPTTVCAVPPVPAGVDEPWSITAIAQLPTGAVVVMTNGVAPPGDRALVVDAVTCAVLAELTG